MHLRATTSSHQAERKHYDVEAIPADDRDANINHPSRADVLGSEVLNAFYGAKL